MYLHVQGGSHKKGANLEVSNDPTSSASLWRLEPTGERGVFAIESAESSTYVNLRGGNWWLGVNTILWDNPQSADSQWRIKSAWSSQIFEEKSPEGVSLLEQTVKQKGRPAGAMPARCDEASSFFEKRGAWCYEQCPEGYIASGSRCKALCSAAYPGDSDLMCGRQPGAVEAAIAKMVAETVRQVITISGLVAAMNSSGIFVAGGLTGTMQALIDMGKPFVHPICPV